ncbi:MAG: MoxR family ATPase [Nocardioides sp.]
MTEALSSAAEVRRRFDEEGYLADEGMATAVFLTLRLGLPLLLEGEPGVGKTAAAQTLARVLDAPLVRLQCYEGLTAAEALYDWNHQRQLLAIRIAESQHERIGEADLFSEEFLVERPILRCIRHEGPRAPVLLIDEVDRADDEFEALLLEALGESSVTVPELGTFTAVRPPIVVLTSNRSRDLHDALRRRCLYHWLEYPGLSRVVAILRRSAPSADRALIESAAQFVGHVRGQDLDKPPGVAEAINWVAALSALGATELVREVAVPSLGALAKTPDDRDLVLASLETYSFG